MITTLWQQTQIKLDEAYKQYETAIREAQWAANGGPQAGSFPRQMAVCEMVKQSTVKYFIVQIGIWLIFEWEAMNVNAQLASIDLNDLDCDVCFVNEQ